MRAMGVRNQEDLVVPFWRRSQVVSQISGWGAATHREGQWEKSRLFEEAITHHGQRDSHKADKCVGLELRQNV